MFAELADGSVVLPTWAAVMLGVGLPILTLLGKSAMSLFQTSRHEDRADKDQLIQHYVSSLAAMQFRHDHFSQVIEEQGIKHVGEIAKLRQENLDELTGIKAKQEVCEEQHKECKEQYSELKKEVVELQRLVKK